MARKRRKLTFDFFIFQLSNQKSRVMRKLTILFHIFQVLLFFRSNAQPLACNPTADPGEICIGEPAQLHVNASGGSGNYTYLWMSNPAGFSSDLENPVVYPYYQPTIYSVVVNDGQNTAEGSVTVPVHDLPIPDAGPNQTIPHGTSTILNGSGTGGSGNYNFHWEPADKVINPFNAQTSTVNLYSTTLFTLVVTDVQSGCVCHDPEEITVTLTGSALSANPTANPDSVCPGDSAQLFALAGGGSGSYTYIWTSDPAGFTSTSADPLVIPAEPTVYTVQVFDGYNVATGSVPVSIHDVPVADAGPDRAISPGNSTILFGSASSGSGNYLYHWEPADKLIDPDVAQPSTIQLFDATQFSLNVTDAQTGCECNPMDNILVNVSGSALGINPEVRPQFICTGGSAQLFANAYGGSGIYSYTWTSNPPGFESDLPDPVVFPSETTTYNILVSDSFNNVIGAVALTIVVFNFQDQICIINVDSLQGKNVIMWDKTQDEAIASYNIYRESTAGGNYNIIGNVDHNEPGIFTDISSNPLQRSFSYGLTTLDTCNSESSVSTVHTTMHLNINTGINSYNLIWTPYYGFDYQTYFIYRRQAPFGFQVIDAVPNSITSYTDLNPPEGILDYVIEIRNENGCNPQKGIKSYVSLFSNIISTNVGIEDQESLSGLISIFPNPFSESTGISYLLVHESYVNIQIINPFGQLITKLVNEMQSKGMHQVRWNGEGVPAGIYFYQITAGDKAFTGKIVVVR